MLIDLRTAADMHWPLSVVRGRTPMNGTWSWTDRVLQAAYRVYLAGICDGCGGYLDETTDAKVAGPQGTHVHKHDKPVKCWTCDARASHLGEIAKNEKHPRLLRWLTRLVPRESG